MTQMQLCASSIITPLGADPATAWAAIAAGLSAYQRCRVFGRYRPEQPFAPIPEDALDIALPPKLPGLSAPQTRLLKIAATALEGIVPGLPEMPLPLFLAGPEPYHQPGPVNRPFIGHLVEATGLQLDKANSRYLGTGRCGTLEALQCAAKALDNGDCTYALVGGIDTFYDPDTLSVLADDERLANDGHSGGFIPGEAAGFLLLSRTNNEPEGQSSPLLLAAPALSYEPGHLRSDQPYTAEALANACLQAAKALDTPIDTLFTSENGEYHYHREVSVAWMRMQRRLTPEAPVWRPAEFLGDLGAAYGTVAIALAGERIRAGESQHTLICASSDGGARGATTLSLAHGNDGKTPHNNA